MADKRSGKVKTAFFCTQCGAEHTRWQGQCRECAEWNTLVEERLVKPAGGKGRGTRPPAEARRLPEISLAAEAGIESGIGEFDRVLGGRLLPGMSVLIGGEPGIGKSTLLLQAAEAYSRRGHRVAYVTGEESLAQIRLRAERLGVAGENIVAVNANALEEICDLVAEGAYEIVLVDSIQTVASAMFDSPPGTVAQVRESAQRLMGLARQHGFALFLVGHVTKDGMVAGPKVLEHMVDTVISFEGDGSHLYRMLRVMKNRFGSVAEIGLFEMQSRGLVEVTNPSSLFLSQRQDARRTGSVVAGICEGQRPLLVEIQALVTAASYGNPQRVAGGIDNKRLALLIAILEKKGGFPMGMNDVFVSIAGGLRLSEPALDLAMLAAIASSLLNKPVDPRTMVVGEVGLSGEVRGVTMIDRRLAEAAKLGFTAAVIPAMNAAQAKRELPSVHGVGSLQEAIEVLLG
ncbi:MAG: DNA repair protein RadA [candidate division Zixibacteria bacterium]|nr:DNA repair protein RadA [candidate division Zixibacteria bacterium]